MRRDIKAALTDLQIRRSQENGGYVSLSSLLTDAALLLLADERIDLAAYPLPTEVKRKTGTRKPHRRR